ncbi:MAG: response regulator transcription factor, partial [Hyphomicrobiales bacterium]|nr:response regulator transcription factor [Hyphomicrobiales bacterium]
APTRELRFGRLALDLGGGGATVDGAALALTLRERSALEALLRRAGATVPKEALLERVYGADEEGSHGALEVVVHRLRKKLAGSGATIATLRGLGYLLRGDDG